VAGDPLGAAQGKAQAAAAKSAVEETKDEVEGAAKKADRAVKPKGGGGSSS
jgi:uncharacterized protein YjbJ (UPF0337 family)